MNLDCKGRLDVMVYLVSEVWLDYLDLWDHQVKMVTREKSDHLVKRFGT